MAPGYDGKIEEALGPGTIIEAYGIYISDYNHHIIHEKVDPLLRSGIADIGYSPVG